MARASAADLEACPEASMLSSVHISVFVPVPSSRRNLHTDAFGIYHACKVTMKSLHTSRPNMGSSFPSEVPGATLIFSLFQIVRFVGREPEVGVKI